MKVAALIGAVVAIASLFFGAVAEAQSNACALLKPTDLTALLGATPIAAPASTGCIWSVSGSTKKLIAITYSLPAAAAAMAYDGARGAAAKSGAVTDEAGLGDKAFSSLASFGVAVMMLKQGRLLQIQYWSGGTGTARDADAVRPLAKQAIAAY